MKSLVQTVVVDYQEQWSLICFERKNARRGIDNVKMKREREKIILDMKKSLLNGRF